MAQHFVSMGATASISLQSSPTENTPKKEPNLLKRLILKLKGKKYE